MWWGGEISQLLVLIQAEDSFVYNHGVKPSRLGACNQLSWLAGRTPPLPLLCISLRHRHPGTDSSLYPHPHIHLYRQRHSITVFYMCLSLQSRAEDLNMNKKHWSQSGGRMNGQTLTTAVAMPIPRDVQLSIRVKKPDTMILDGEKDQLRERHRRQNK